MSLTPMETGWLAGIIDGEGSLGIYRVGRNHSAGLQIISTDECLMNEVDRLVAKLGIQKPSRRYACTRCTRGQYWKLSVNRKRQLEVILTAVREGLILKAPQADLVLSFCAKRYHRWNPPTKSDRAAIMDMADQCKQLNQRRIPSEPAPRGPCRDLTRTPKGKRKSTATSRNRASSASSSPGTSSSPRPRPRMATPSPQSTPITG